MGIYRRPDSPTWWMSLQIDGHRVRINTMVEDGQLAKELFGLESRGGANALARCPAFRYGPHGW